MAVEVAGTSIRIPQGDTGVVRFIASPADGIEEGDKGVFTLARRDGAAILRKIMSAENGEFYMMFVYEDTAKLRPDAYEWSMRVVRGAEFDASGKILGADVQHTAVINGRLSVVAAAGGAR